MKKQDISKIGKHVSPKAFFIFSSSEYASQKTTESYHLLLIMTCTLYFLYQRKFSFFLFFIRFMLCIVITIFTLFKLRRPRKIVQ